MVSLIRQRLAEESKRCRVTLTSRDGTARAGVDYGAFQITLSWNFGEGGLNLSIRIIDNTWLMALELFVDVSNAVGIDPTSSFSQLIFSMMTSLSAQPCLIRYAVLTAKPITTRVVEWLALSRPRRRLFRYSRRVS